MSFMGTCVDNPFGSVQKLSKMIERGKEISRRIFFKYCPLPKNAEFGTISFSISRQDMFKYPNDFEYYKIPKTSIYYFVHSCVEFFFEASRLIVCEAEQ